MSVRFNSQTDTADLSAAMTYNGAWTIAGWVKLVTDRNTYTPFLQMDVGGSSPADFTGIGTDSNGTSIFGFTISNSTTPYAASVSTWYYVVLSRSGALGAIRARVWLDTATTTPTSNQTAAASGTGPMSFTRFGQSGFTGEFLDGEMVAWKAWQGVELSDANCETERHEYGVQTNTGSQWAAWTFADTTTGNADTTGNGRNLTFANLANGATVPSQLNTATNITVNLGSVSATGTLGTLAIQNTSNATVTLDSVVATGTVTAPGVTISGPAVDIALGSVFATGTVNETSVATDVSIGLDSVFATGTVTAPAVQSNATIALGSVVATGTVTAPSVTTVTDITVTLGSVSAQGQASGIRAVVPGTGTGDRTRFSRRGGMF